MKLKRKNTIQGLQILNILILFFLIVISITAKAQDKTIKKGSQEWIQYYAQAKLSNKWIWSIDGGYRWNELLKNPSQYIVRTGLGFQLNNHMKVSAGFAHLGFYTLYKISKLEYRPYEEFAINDKYNSLSVQHRFRIEERYFKSVFDGNTQPGNTFNFRFRYQFSMNIKLIKLSATKPDKIFSANMGDEIFINAGKEIVYNVLDQNRFLIGPAISFTKDFTVGITYNTQFAATTTAKSYVHTDVFWLTVKQNFDISKHRKQT
jgi:hypothetical protein